MSGFVNPFPGRVEHQPDEPGYALFLRTALDNGGRLVNALFDKAGPGDRARVSTFDPLEIARICKADPVAVAHATPAVTPTVVKVMGQVLRAEQVSVERRRWCPRCLDEHGYHRVWWDITVVTTCPRHGVELATSCGCERRPLRWRNNRLLSCGRGHDLRTVETGAANAGSLALDGYILARLLDEPRHGPAWLDDVDLGDLLAICERLGKASAAEDATIFEARRSVPVGWFHAEGFRILSDLPGAFDSLLDAILASSDGRQGKRGVLKAYGEFYNWVRTLPDEGPGRHLKGCLARHAVANLTLKSGTRIDGKSPVVHDGVAVSEAAVACGMGYVRFRKLLDQLDIAVRGEGMGSRVEMDRDAFDALAGRLKGFRILKQVGVDLDLPQEDVAELARAGLVDLIAEGEGTSDWVFPAGAASGLLAQIRQASTSTRILRHWHAPVTAAARELQASLAEVLRLGFDGKVALVTSGPIREGLGKVYVDRRELARHLGDAPGRSLALAAAARELDLKQSALDAVIAAGLLRVDRDDGIDRVTRAAVDAFKAAYVTITEAREILGLAAFQPVAAALAQAGVAPVATGTRLTDHVYPREPVLAALARARRPAQVAVVPGRNRKEIAKELRMEPSMLRQLVDADLIRMQEGCPLGSIADSEVARFKAAYATTSDLAAAFGIKGWKTVLAVVQAAGIEPLCRPPEFEAFVFPRGPAEAAIRAHQDGLRADRKRAGSATEPMLTLDEVSAKLGVVRNMALQLTQKRVLKSGRVGRAIMVPVSEVERFARDYVLGNELGTLAGRTDGRGSGPTITRALIQDGVVPVCSRPEFYSYVFRRDEAVAAMRRLRLQAIEAAE